VHRGRQKPHGRQRGIKNVRIPSKMPKNSITSRLKKRRGVNAAETADEHEKNGFKKVARDLKKRETNLSTLESSLPVQRGRSRTEGRPRLETKSEKKDGSSRTSKLLRTHPTTVVLGSTAKSARNLTVKEATRRATSQKRLTEEKKARTEEGTRSRGKREKC